MVVLPPGFEPGSCPNLEPMPVYKTGVLPLNYRRINLHERIFGFEPKLIVWKTTVLTVNTIFA